MRQINSDDLKTELNTSLNSAISDRNANERVFDDFLGSNKSKIRWKDFFTDHKAPLVQEASWFGSKLYVIQQVFSGELYG